MILNNKWDYILRDEFNKKYFHKLMDFIEEEYTEKTIFPPRDKVFNAFIKTPYDDIKVVILGQDPYHGSGMANGICFSVDDGVKIPKSLKNIFKELEEDMTDFLDKEEDLEYWKDFTEKNKSGNLIKWAENGIFLLNAILTVEEGKAGSHRGKGWEDFTDKVIELLNERKEPIVFILWGSFAQSKEELIKGKHHLVLKGAHPSPLSAYRGFFGEKYFSKSKEFLKKQGKDVDWSLKN